MPSEKVSISLLVRKEEDQRLRALAALCGRTKSAYIRQIIRRYFRYLDTWDSPEGPAVDWDI